MARIVVNGSELATSSAAQTWAEVLDCVDRDVAPRGQIVTAVRFDGVEEPAFRDPTVTARALASLERIEIEAGTPHTLIERCLGEAAATVGSLCDAALQIADDFRGHDIETANRNLAGLADGLRSLMGIIGAAGLALRMDLQTVSCDGRPVSGMVTEFTGFLESLIAAQQSGDWITVADVLQYDIEPALRRWAGVFDAVVALA